MVELDVRSQKLANAAVATVITEAGQLDVVVHNAGHVTLGYMEAYSAEEVAGPLDVNALGAQRVNRAVLPHMRARRSGAAEVARVLALPIGQKPRRTIVDFTQSAVERVTTVAEAEVADFLTRIPRALDQRATVGVVNHETSASPYPRMTMPSFGRMTRMSSSTGRE